MERCSSLTWFDVKVILVIVLAALLLAVGSLFASTIAVLINGGGLQGSQAYSRDIERAYNVCSEFADEIIVHQTDGQDPNADSAYLLGFWGVDIYHFTNPSISSPAGPNYREAASGTIAETFSELSEQLTPADELFVLIVGHGHLQTGSMWLQDGPLDPDAFVSLLDTVDCPQTVVMTQCYAEAHVPAMIQPDRGVVYSEGVIVEWDEVVYMGGARDGEIIEGQTPWLTHFLDVYDGGNLYESYNWAQVNDPYGPTLGPGWKAQYPDGPGQWMTEMMHYIPEPLTGTLIFVNLFLVAITKKGK